MSALDEFKELIHRCFRCGYCKFTGTYLEYNCSSYLKFRFESYSTGGRLWLAYGLTSGALQWSSHLADILYACTTCGNCTEHCKFDKFNFALVEIIEAARADARSAGMLPAKAEAFGKHVEKEHNPYFESHASRLNWLPEGFRPAKDAEMGFFVGCTASYRQQKMAQNTLEIMQKVGLSFTILPEEWCCGSPLQRTGQRDIARAVAEHNVTLYTDRGIRTVVTACAGCFRTLKVDYPKILGKPLPFEVLHISELVLRLLEEGRLNLKGKFEGRATYHDPCHLGRHAHLYDAPREVLKRVPGMVFVEMRKNRGDATCCGAGGGVKANFGDWALEMGTNRVKESVETGASVLVTTCPFCEHNFSDAIQKGDQAVKKIRLYDLVEIINQVT